MKKNGNVKKRHHYVPQRYLEGFADSKKQVWVLDTEDKIFPTNPTNVLVETHFYRLTLKDGTKSVVIEDWLADLEGKYTNIFEEKISKEIFLTVKERAQVAVFLAALFHRTKTAREGMRNMITKVKDTGQEWRNQFESLSAEQRAKLIPMEPTGNSITLDEIEGALKDFDEHHTAILPDQIEKTAQILFDMKWAIFKYPGGMGNFLTSDSPFVLRRPASEIKYGRNTIGSRPGLKFEDVEVTAPLSKDRLLLAGWILKANSYGEASEMIAKSFNQRTILDSSERIIACNQAQLEQILADYPAKK